MNSIQTSLVIIILCLAILFSSTVIRVKAISTKEVEDDFANIDEYVDAQRERLGIPGLSLGIVQGDQIVHLKGFGIADSLGKPVTAQTPFHIGSLTKSFTALAVMQLVEAGKIDLDVPVKTYLSWFTLADEEASARITVRHLLNHTSGISEKDGNRFWSSAATMEEAVRQMRRIHLSHPVGTKFQYCNLNYVVLGLIVEKISGQTYADYVTGHILSPLDMHNSYASHSDAAADGLSDGHYYVLNRAYKRDGVYPPAYLATGLLISSAEDMSHYLITHLNAGKYGEIAVLSQQGVAELHNPSVPMAIPGRSYAMGWSVSSFDGVNSISHRGDITNFHGIVIMQPENGHGVVMLANATGFVQIMQLDDIANGVMNLLNGKQPTLSTMPFMLRFLYWSILLTVFLQIIWTAYVLLQGQPNGWQSIVALILNVAVGIFFLFGVPGLVPFPLSSLTAYYPEIGFALIFGATIGFGSSLARIIAYLWTR